MNRTKINDDINLTSLKEVVDGLTGFNLNEEDYTDEVILQSIVFLKLHDIEGLFQRNGVELEFTDQVTEYICDQASGLDDPVTEINKSLTNTILKFLMNNKTKEKIKKGGKYIVDIFDGECIFRHSIAFEV